MAWLTVTTEHGSATLQERVAPIHMASEHYRRCLVDRLAWAVDDAAQSETAPGAVHDLPIETSEPLPTAA